MESIQVQGHVDGEHNLSASVPVSIPPGPVTVLIVPTILVADDAEGAWSAGIAREWADDLADARQDIYTLVDGDAYHAS